MKLFMWTPVRNAQNPVIFSLYPQMKPPIWIPGKDTLMLMILDKQPLLKLHVWEHYYQINLMCLINLPVITLVKDIDISYIMLIYVKYIGIHVHQLTWKCPNYLQRLSFWIFRLKKKKTVSSDLHHEEVNNKKKSIIVIFYVMKFTTSHVYISMQRVSLSCWNIWKITYLEIYIKGSNNSSD